MQQASFFSQTLAPLTDLKLRAKFTCLLVDLQGCASWKWYFPFHYAPFASDFKDIKDMFSDFEKNTKPVRMDLFLSSSFSIFLSVTFQ